MVAMVTVMAQYWQKFEVLYMKDVVCILKEYEQNRGFHEYGMIIYQNAKIGR
jgi:hypothetical protein